MMKRTIFDEDHDAFRDVVRDFVAKEVAPNIGRGKTPVASRGT